MRKRLFAIVLALTAAIGIFGGTASGAVRSAQVDTITMDAEMPDDEVAVDLGWKTQQDKGRWIVPPARRLSARRENSFRGTRDFSTSRERIPVGRKIFRSTAMFPVDRMMILRCMVFTVWRAPSEVRMIRAVLHRTGNLRKMITGSRIRTQTVSA